MCIGVPGQLISLDGSEGMVDTKGIRRRVNTFLVPEAVVGDFVMVHAGSAIQIIDAEEAEETLALLEELLRDEGI